MGMTYPRLTQLTSPGSPPLPAVQAQPQPRAPTPDTLSPKLERAATFGGPSFSTRYEAQSAYSGRMPAPPRIDSQAASTFPLLFLLSLNSCSQPQISHFGPLSHRR